MKRVLLAAIGLSLLAASAPARAADLPAKKYTKAPPAIVARVYDWSGFYGGINAGGGSSRNCWTLTRNAGVAVNPAAGREGCNSAGGAAVGGQIGYRYQVTNWVFGLEAQGDWAGFQGTSRDLALAGLSDRSRLNGFGLFTGQVGYAFNNVLGYIKGGAAVAGDRYEVLNAAGAVVDSAKSTRWGGAVGAGVEYGFAPNWSVGVEYDHLFLGNKNLNFVNAAGASTMMRNISQDADIGLVRLNYKFGGPLMMKF